MRPSGISLGLFSTIASRSASSEEGPALEGVSTIKNFRMEVMRSATVANSDRRRSSSRIDPAWMFARLRVWLRAWRPEWPSDTPLRLGQEQAGQRPRWARCRLPAAMDVRSPSSTRRDTRRVRQLAAHSRRRWRRRLDSGRIAVRSEDRVGRSLVSSQAGAASESFQTERDGQCRCRAARSGQGGYVRRHVVSRARSDLFGVRSAIQTVGRLSRRSILKSREDHATDRTTQFRMTAPFIPSIHGGDCQRASDGARCLSSPAQTKPSTAMIPALANRVGILPACWSPKP